MKLTHDLDEDDIKAAIKDYVKKLGFNPGTVTFDAEPRYGFGTEDGTIVGHEITAKVTAKVEKPAPVPESFGKREYQCPICGSHDPEL